MARQHLSTPAQENSTYIIVVALKDEGNVTQLPATMKWTLSGTDGVVIATTTLTPSEGSIGEAALTIILTGSHLAITGNEDEAIRILTVEGTYPEDGNAFTGAVTFAIEQMRAI